MIRLLKTETSKYKRFNIIWFSIVTYARLSEGVVLRGAVALTNENS